MPVNPVTDSRSAKLFRRLVQFRCDTEIITKKLRYITPILAIMPRKAWEVFCKEHDLFRLNPSIYGEVRYSQDMFKEADEHARMIPVGWRNPFFGYVAIPIVFSIWMLTMWHYGFFAESEEMGFAYGFIGIMLGLISAAIVTVILAVARGNMRKKESARIVRERIADAYAHGTLPNLLWPKSREPSSVESNEISIVTPEGPAHVLRTLTQHGIVVRQAFAADAIAFTEHPVNLIFNETPAFSDTKPRTIAADSVVIYYVVEQSAVAIVGFRGNVTISTETARAVVDTVQRMAS
jgi:uncharacterized membrane protein